MKAFIKSVAILALIVEPPLASWISHNKEAQLEIVREVVAEERTADAQTSDLPANILISHPKEPRKRIDLAVPLKATMTDKQADYLATHILDWPTDSLNPSESLEEFREFNRALDIETSRIITNKVLL